MRNWTAVVVMALAAGCWGQQGLGPIVTSELPGLVTTYKHLHENPELSHQEAKTSAYVAAQLRALGYTVTDHVGKYENPAWTGYGVVALLHNGAGPTLMMRSELDALPVTEDTGLAYSSHITARNDAGQVVGVMHACGHDIHMSALLGTAEAMVKLKSQWHGTLMLVFQPAEETINGAKAMLDDGLYTRFPRPDMIVGEHDTNGLAAGKVGYLSGYSMASATSVRITLHGVSAHGSLPEASKDPVVAAAELVLALQTIVSRETSPFDQAVVTVGSIQAGTKNNIIPDSATLLLTIRTYKEEVRQRILASIKRMADGVALAAGLPAAQPPTVAVYEYTKSLYNDPQLTERAVAVLQKALGKANVVDSQPVMASEDFGYFGLDHKIPEFFLSLGAVSQQALDASRASGVPLPSLHSSKFAPLPEPTIRTGVTAMTSLAVALLQ